MSWRSPPGRMMVTGLATIALVACNPGDPGTWKEGERYGQWRLKYHGFGSVTGDDQSVIMQPKAADAEDVTHACLVVTEQNFQGNLDFSMLMRTEEQVRIDTPNTWEVGWVLWNYQDDEHFYALALKPNGWELSKQDPDYRGNQRFLMSGTEPKFPVDQEYRVRIVQMGNTITAYADDHLLGEVTDTETPYDHGAIGLYTEDARVRFSGLYFTTPSDGSG
ncbi:hypothetical protein NYP18_06335 [Corynebacterium sp. YIM 101645]|uniref:Calcium-binding protein n=1 Tax=Corynebacterium lemuris TaxID=1859292 RepID=A0ABT2FVK4_9CORY|nr:hypothetical protein [Corynebacterium lemuris]MCS5479271.1 hypothetical protein [Corynebacterium lemuris]